MINDYSNNLMRMSNENQRKNLLIMTGIYFQLKFLQLLPQNPANSNKTTKKSIETLLIHYGYQN